MLLCLCAMFPVRMQLPGEYTEHVFCIGMREMMLLGPKDCVVEFTDVRREYNSTWLGILSPFFRTGFHMFPGIESRDKRYMQLQDVNSTLFEQLAELACGFTIRVGQWEHLEALYWLADMLRMEVVTWHLEQALLVEVNNDTWYKALRTRCDLNNRIKDWAFSRALRNFEELKLSADVDEETMHALVSHNDLSVHTEDAVLRAVVSWIRAQVQDDQWNGEGARLLREIRHDVLAAPRALEHLRDDWQRHIRMCPKRTMRNGFSVPWSKFHPGEFVEDSFHPKSVSGSLVTTQEWGPLPTGYNTFVCLNKRGVLSEFSIPSLRRKEFATMLPPDPNGEYKELACMAVWGDYVVWSQQEGGLFMWNYVAQTRAYEMEGLYALQMQPHAMLIQGIAVCEPYMLSASVDMIKVWRRRSEQSLSCDNTVANYAPNDYGGVKMYAELQLVAWDGRAITAFCNEIKVTNAFTSQVEAKLSTEAEGDNHFELLVCNQWLYRAHRDGTITMWRCGGQWPVLRTVRLTFFDEDPRPYMTISGSSLVCGTHEGVVVVLNATDLEEEHRIYCNRPIYGLFTLTNGGVVGQLSGHEILCWVR